MLMIMFLGLIAKIALVCGECNIRTWGVDSFNWTKVGIMVLIQILKHHLLKLLLAFTHGDL
jgi:hypothetical protein